MNETVISIAATTTATSALLAAVGYLMFPRCKEFVWRTLEQNTEKYDKLRMDSIRRTPEGASFVVRTILATELAELELMKKQVQSHTDSMLFLQTALTQQGEQMKQLPQIAESLRASARAVEEVARTVHSIHEEVQDHGRRLERWDGFMEGRGEWDGRDRRGRGRRKPDHDE